MVTLTLEDVRAAVAAVLDPELPLVTIDELGILRDVSLVDGHAVVTITPTYSGCPAMEAIADDVRAALASVDAEGEVRTALAPAWTTDWISPAGRVKLAEAGIAPPGPAGSSGTVMLDLAVRCPRCASTATRVVSRFGSTACKALRVCSDCAEPFDEFKPL
ncbi:MAG: ring,2-phenylacetyl-CoA epoxidase subunit PaaD [Frankiales bacterium]|nr:ring,2-phenylacetyl-CoA epoxidase subunit PaaD [Frankiales bacterium]